MTQTVAAVPAHDAGARRPGASHGPPKGSEDLFGPLLARATQPVREGKGPEQSEHSARTARAEGAQEAPADAEAAVATDPTEDGQPVPAEPLATVDAPPAPPQAEHPEQPEAPAPAQQPAPADAAEPQAATAPVPLPVDQPAIPAPPVPQGEAPVAIPSVEQGEAPLGPVAPADPQAIAGQPVDPTLDGPAPIAPTPLPASTAAVADPQPAEAPVSTVPTTSEPAAVPVEEQAPAQAGQQPQGGSTGGDEPRDEQAPRPGVHHERRIGRDDDRHGRPEAPGRSAEAPGQTVAQLAQARRESAAEAAPPASAPQPQAPAAPGAQPGVDPTLAVLQGGAPGQPTELRLHSRLHELGSVTRLVVRMAAREEATQARITLEPGDLGQVRISLKYHAGGISAEVVADSVEAAQALQQTVGDLKRSLEAQGVVVHGLDVRLAGDDGQRAGRDSNAPTPGKGRGESGYELDDDGIAIDPGSLPLAGSQVDVLA